MSYAEVYGRWKADPEAFWLDAAGKIDWVSPPTKALFDENAPIYEWFSDGRVNACWNAVDRHVEAGHGDRVAIIHDSPVTGSVHKITYRELRDRVASLAGALRAKGVDAIACMAVNDAFVMAAWARDQGLGEEIAMLADGSAAFTRALGLEMDLGARGMGVRCQRFALIARDGKVAHVGIEAPGAFEASKAETILAAL